MKRLSQRLLRPTIAGMMIFASAGGCARWRNDKETIIRVQARQDPARARRLTLVGVKEMGFGNVDVAAEKFIAAVAADETYGPAHNNLGLLHYDDGNLYQAVLAFEQAMEFMPHDPAVYYNLALALESAGRVSEAMELYYQAVAMAPTNPFFLGNLVRLRIRLGETGPDLQAQLEDLCLIETRPEWRRWADRQRALFFNDALDRGPETPDFNPNGDDDEDEAIEFNIQDRIIDLTPAASTTALPAEPTLKASETIPPPSPRPRMIPGTMESLPMPDVLEDGFR